MTSGANLRNRNVIWVDAFRLELMRTQAPEIEMVFTDPEILKIFWKYFSVGGEFRTTGPERRSYGGHQIFSPATEKLLHQAYDLSQNVLHVSSPAAMDIGDHIFQGIKEDYLY